MKRIGKILFTWSGGAKTCVVTSLFPFLVGMAIPGQSSADYRTLHDLKIDWAGFQKSGELQNNRSALFGHDAANAKPTLLAEEIDRSQVPVLVPSDLFSKHLNALKEGKDTKAIGSLGTHFNFIMTPSGYAAVFKGEEFDFVCRGYGTTLLTEGKTVEALESETQPVISGNSLGGYVATFVKFGASYACEIMCRGAKSDKWGNCVDENTLLSLVKNLTPIGPVK